MGQIFVLGGENSAGNAHKTMEVYNAHKDKWILNEKLIKNTQDNCTLFRDKSNPNIIMLSPEKKADCGGQIEWLDLRDHSPRRKWSMLEDQSLIRFFDMENEKIELDFYELNCIKIIIRRDGEHNIIAWIVIGIAALSAESKYEKSCDFVKLVQ